MLSTLEWITCCCSVTKSCLTLCNPMNCSTLFPCPSLSPWVCSNTCPLSQWCHPTIPFSVALFPFCPQSFQHQGLFHWVGSLHQVAKLMELLLQHQGFHWMNNAAAAKSLQSCPTLCSPIDGSPPDSAFPWILQARKLEWVAISFSSACMHAKPLQLRPTLCDPIDDSPPGSPVPGFSRQEYWSGLPFPSPWMNNGCA